MISIYYNILLRHWTNSLIVIARPRWLAPDPDSFGFFDRLEHLTGLGFVACQIYIASTYSHIGLSKESALTLGPQHHCGISIVAVVNHAANLWKHQDEWALQRNERARDRIIKAFEDLGYPALGEYPLSGCLAELCTPEEARFRRLLPHLVQWREKLRKA